MWATIRWSGRTDWPSMCQPRLSTSIVSTMPKPRAAQLVAQLHGLRDLRRVGHQHAAAVHGAGGVLDHPPRLGQVEHHPVEVGLVDALVDVALLDRVPVERVAAEEGGHVLDRPVGEVLAQLVAGTTAPARTSVIDSAPDPTPDSSTRAPGKMSASMRIGPRSLG